MSGARVGLIATCEDKQLFGFRLWKRQRELLAALERGRRLHVLALGRRSGKTTLGRDCRAEERAAEPELDAFLRPGERRHAVALATNLKQPRLFVRAALSIVERSPLSA